MSSPDRRAPGRIALTCVVLTCVPVAEAGAPTTSQPVQSPLVVRVDSGFDWGDAGIGAAAGFGAALVLAGSLALTCRGLPLPGDQQQKENPR